MAALHWLVEGFGYEITSVDVRAAYSHSLKAAENAGVVDETRARIRELVSRDTSGERFVTRVLGGVLGLLQAGAWQAGRQALRRPIRRRCSLLPI